MPSDEHFSTAKINTFWKFIFQKKPKLFLFPFCKYFSNNPLGFSDQKIQKRTSGLWRVMFLLSFISFSEVCKFLKNKSKRKMGGFPELKREKSNFISLPIQMQTI